MPYNLFELLFALHIVQTQGGERGIEIRGNRLLRTESPPIPVEGRFLHNRIRPHRSNGVDLSDLLGNRIGLRRRSGRGEMKAENAAEGDEAGQPAAEEGAAEDEAAGEETAKEDETGSETTGDENGEGAGEGYFTSRSEPRSSPHHILLRDPHIEETMRKFGSEKGRTR